MGHVPPGPLPPAGPGAHFPRRQHRAPRGVGALPLNRSDVGSLGEAIARWYLIHRGLDIVATNVHVGRGEIDILARDGSVRVAVEVRTRRGGDDPVDAADPAKREHASGLARRIGARRFDVVGVALDRDGVDIHWVPGAS